MDVLRRSFRRSVRRSKRKPLSESPNTDSPRTVDEPTSVFGQLRSSFRHSSRRPSESLTTFVSTSSQQSSHGESDPTTIMNRLRRSIRRSVHREPLSESPRLNSNPIDNVPVSPSPVGKATSKLQRSFRGRRGPLFEDPKPVRSCNRGGIDGPFATLEKLRRSFRKGMRRDEDHTSDAPKLNYWQADELDVEAGTCFFNVKYLGCMEVFEPRGLLMCEEAMKILKKSRKRPIKSLLFVSANGLRVVEKDTRGLLVDQSIDMLSFCGPVRNHDKGFAFICLNSSTLKWMCYCFVAKEPGERLSNAAGCAFALYFERKKKRDEKCRLTMNFDLSSSTFTRVGSLCRQSLVEKRKMNHMKNNLDSVLASSNTTTSNLATTIININNNINTDDENKENIPVELTSKSSGHHFEQSVFTAPTLRRQQSFRELSTANNVSSPFKRQLSLRLRDLPSTIERIQSQTAKYLPSPRTPNIPFTHLKTPVSPIAEISPGPSAKAESMIPSITKQMDRTTAIQQLSQKFLASRTADSMTPKSSQFNVIRKCLSENTFTRNLTDYSLPILDHRPLDCPQINDDQEPELEPSSSKGGSHSFEPNLVHILPSQSSMNNALTPLDTPFPAKIGSNPELAITSQMPLPPNGMVTPLKVIHSRSYSSSYADNMVRSSSSPKVDDPFNVDWTLWLTSSSNPKKKNTNPFLIDSPVRDQNESSSN